MYLNDVEEGGETAFPVAGGPLMTESVSSFFALMILNQGLLVSGVFKG